MNKALTLSALIAAALLSGQAFAASQNSEPSLDKMAFKSSLSRDAVRADIAAARKAGTLQSDMNAKGSNFFDTSMSTLARDAVRAEAVVASRKRSMAHEGGVQ